MFRKSRGWVTTSKMDGKKIAPIFSWGGCDVDFKWQIPMVEYWLLKNGFKKNENRKKLL